MVLDGDDPLLVFGGPYGNLQATEALFRAARRTGIAPDRMLCTGDVIGYCGDPLATVQLIRASGIAVVMGNCEEQIGAAAADCGCGYAPGTVCDALSAEWFRFAAAEVDEASRAWMRGLPRRARVRFAGRHLLAIHGGVRRINRFLFASTAWRSKAAEIAAAGGEGVLAGHCGIPFTQIVADRLWHNAGVIGMPANDGLCTTWYAVIRRVGRTIRIEHRRLDYPHRAAARRMRRRGLSHHYADALMTGRWPSLDVLPQAERRRTGAPIPPSIHCWAGSPERQRSATAGPSPIDAGRTVTVAGG